MLIHIDTYKIKNLNIFIQGYVVSESNTFTIRLGNKEITDRKLRSDVNMTYNLPDDHKAGFSLKSSIFCIRKLYIHDEQYNENIHLGLPSLFKFNIMKILRKINSKRKEYGVLGLVNVCIKKLLHRKTTDILSYQDWRLKNTLCEDELKKQRAYIFDYQPKFSIVVPTYNTPIKFLEEMIESVKQQTYSNWELCIADASQCEDTRAYLKKLNQPNVKIKYLNKNLMISGNSNEALSLCTGEFIILLDHDDLLASNALFEVANVLNTDRTYDFIYSDEDKVDEKGNIYSQPHFKPDFAIDNLRSYNYITHLAVIRKTLLDQIGYFDSSCDGAQDYDLFLRICDYTDKIYHIPNVLYHWRIHQSSTSADAEVKPYVLEAGKRALRKHLERNEIEGSVSDGLFPTSYKIDYQIQGKPLISILIPNKDHIQDLKRCLSSIIEKSTYRNFEIVIVENNSEENETFKFYETLDNHIINVVTWEGSFNYSKINNYGRTYCKGEYIVLLNNDIEVISEHWLEEMLMQAQRKEVGAVGAKLYYPNGKIQHAGVIVGIGSVAGHSHKYFERGEFGYMGRLKIVQDLSAVTAACMMLKSSVFDEINGLCDDFAVAFNDVDFCLRIREEGYLIVFTPYAELFHYESLSRGEEDNPEKIRRFQGEISLFESKWGLYRYDPYYSIHLSLEKEDFSYKVS